MEKRRIVGSRIVRAAVSVMLLGIAWSSVDARPITREQARQQALTFMQQHHDTRMLSAVEGQQKLGARRMASPQQADAYYVFNRGINEGFIIISGDDATAESVLGYCDSGAFDYEQMPPNMLEWLEGYARQIEALSSQACPSSQANLAPHRVATHPTIPQLMSSKWNQGSPYNDSCPLYFSFGRSVTGCVATAYAQILYYHREKMVTETQAAMPAYTTYTTHETYGNLHVNGIPKGSPIDWDNMRDTYSGNETALQKKAVADLMHYCGVGVKMDYTSSSSGAQSYEVYNSLRNYFGFGSNVRYVSYEMITSDDAWDELVYNELAEGRPFYISGANSEGGHAFVGDGYDGNRRYHINWGWGGASDGYYYLNSLTPGQQGIGGSSDGYNAYREVIIGIEPENYSEKALSFTDATARRLCTEAFDQNGDGTLTYGEAAMVTSLGTVLKESDIKNFNELHYFTSLTGLDDDAFNGCQQLTSVQLPKKLKSIGARAFKDCVKLTAPTLPDGLTSIGEEAFSGCTVMQAITLPSGLATLPARVFAGCKNLKGITLPPRITLIGDEAFASCESMTEFNVMTLQPQHITLGEQVFADAATGQAMLNVMQGTRQHFENDAQWSQFYIIKEVRELSRGQFAPLATKQTFFLYHLGTGRYLTKGEAWGTQAVVGTSNPMRFVIDRTASMPEGTYYLTSEDTERTGHYLFRTSTDSNVGQGVQAAFVDGSGLTNNAHWVIADIGDNTYTLSIPEGYANYNADCRWGVQTDHASNAASPTWGVYSDIVYEGNELNCQWRLVPYDAEQVENFEAARELQNLIDMASAKHLNVVQEQSVLDNLESTTEELREAQRSLRKKLNLLSFADPLVREACISTYDIDADGELSMKEASQVNSLSMLFSNTDITSFEELQYFTGLKEMSSSCFSGCRKLTAITLPESVERIYYSVFRNCSELERINIPEYVSLIYAYAFDGCTSLKTVTVGSPDPATMTLGSFVFNRVNLEEATLQVPAGSKALYEQADVWKDFGTIVEVRTRTQPRFSPITVGVKGYVYNVATRKFLSKGEAYGTQSVVSPEGMAYEWRQSSTMNEGQYYLYSTETGKDGKTLFRTDSDGKVGEGVKACFVDGSLSARAYWQVDSVAELTYTLQVPASDDSYVEGEYLGTMSDHPSDAASPTDGTYWDITMDGGQEKRCQWRFITVDDMLAAQQLDEDIEALKVLLEKCEEQQIDKTTEQAVYDNLQSTAEEIAEAILSLRDKLHFITFADSKAKSICLENWDLNGDDELSYEEAALVTELGEIFRNQSQLKSLESLRYFTALTAISENAFRNSQALVTIYLPQQVTELGKSAFLGCSALKYMVVMNEQQVVDGINSSTPSTTTLFVPAALLNSYLTDENWESNKVTEYTGIPTVRALPASRQYGRSAASMKYEVGGAPINGDPVLTSQEVSVNTTPVGTYTIHVTPGTITSRGLVCLDGELTITPAPLTITAKSYTRKQGEPNPTFEVTYKGWRNRETDEVLLQQPTVSCTATQDSPAGNYDIIVSGAEAQNYEITYVYGVLTIEGDPSAISNISADGNSEVLYDLGGRRVTGSNAGGQNLKKGIYVNRQKRKIIKR